MENGEGLFEMQIEIAFPEPAIVVCQGLQKLYLFSLLVHFLIFTDFGVHAQPAPSPVHPPTHNPTLQPSPAPVSPAPTPKPTLPPSPAPVSPTPKPTPPPLVPPVDPHSGPKQETPPGSESSSGLSGGQKAGIVIGVFAAAGAGWVGWRIYKKRRGNIRRARFGYQARRDMQL